MLRVCTATGIHALAKRVALTKFYSKVNCNPLNIKDFNIKTSIKTFSSTLRPNIDQIVKLHPTEYEEWFKEEVCSLLSTKKKSGGAGLTFDEVLPLYSAGFNGNYLANIIVDINEHNKDFALERLKKTYIEAGVTLTVQLSNTLLTMVNWVNEMHKTNWNNNTIINVSLLNFTRNPTTLKKTIRNIYTDLNYEFNSNPFVDRHDVLLQILNHAFNRTILEKPALVLTISAPGMGKSSLLVEWMHQATNHCKKVVIFRFLNGHEDEDETNLDKWYAKLEKVGIIRKYNGNTILYNEKRYTIQTEETLCDLTTIQDPNLPDFIVKSKSPTELLSIWKQLSEQNPEQQIEPLFKFYGVASKRFLYIAIDEIQQISTTGDSQQNGMYYLLCEILKIWNNENYHVFVLSAGVSIQHSFMVNQAVEKNYPPTPLIESKYLEQIVLQKYGKRLYQKSLRDKGVEMLDGSVSNSLLIGFYKCGGIARCIKELLKAFEPIIIGSCKVDANCIANSTRQSDEAIDLYFQKGCDYFNKLTPEQRAILLWITMIPVSLDNSSLHFNPSLQDLQKVGFAIPFSRLHYTNYYVPYFIRTRLLTPEIKTILTNLLANNDGSTVFKTKYLFNEPTFAHYTRSSNDIIDKNLEMITINSIWSIYKYFRHVQNNIKPSLANLFPDIKFFGKFSSKDLYVEWEGMKLLTSPFDYKHGTTLESNYLYKNCAGAQHGDILFIAKTNKGEQVKVAIECWNLRKEEQVSFSDLIQSGINVLFGRSHLDLKQEISTQKHKNQSYHFTCNDIIDQQGEYLKHTKIQELKEKSAFDVLILLTPNQITQPKNVRKYKTVIDLWKRENQLILFNGCGTIHEHTLKYIKEENIVRAISQY